MARNTTIPIPSRSSIGLRPGLPAGLHDIALIVKAGRREGVGYAAVVPDIAGDPAVADDEFRANHASILRLACEDVVPLRLLFNHHAPVCSTEPAHRLGGEPRTIDPLTKYRAVYQPLPAWANDLDLLAAQRLDLFGVVLIHRVQPRLNHRQRTNHPTTVALSRGE